MPVERYRNLNSRAISFSSWLPTAKDVQAGKRRAGPRSKGTVTIKFRRNPGKYTYVLQTQFTLEKWLQFMGASSVGRTWNYKYLGRV